MRVNSRCVTGVSLRRAIERFGFRDWLAGLLKKEVGTGAMVPCGFDARTVANITRPVRLLEMSMRSGR